MPKLKLSAAQQSRGARRRMDNMLTDLRAMKVELLPDETTGTSAEELASFDSFQKKKHELNGILKLIRNDTDKLTEIRTKAGNSDADRDPTTIRLQSETSANLSKAVALFTSLKEQLKKDATKTFGKKLSEEQLADRTHMVTLLGTELASLTSSASSSGNIMAGEEVVAMQSRVDRQRARQEELRLKRDAARKKRSNRRSGNTGDDYDDVKDAQPASEQEQVFEQKVAENNAQQDEMLAQVSAGLDELKELSLDMNKQLTVQKAMLEQVDTKMDSTIQHFKTANQRMKYLLDESGGMARWCPMIICIVVLLALIGTITKIV